MNPQKRVHVQRGEGQAQWVAMRDEWAANQSGNLVAK